MERQNDSILIDLTVTIQCPDCTRKLNTVMFIRNGRLNTYCKYCAWRKKLRRIVRLRNMKYVFDDDYSPTHDYYMLLEQ